MHDGVKPVFRKYILNKSTIRQIADKKLMITSQLAMPVHKIIQNDDAMPGSMQLSYGVRTYISGSAGDEHVHVAAYR